MTVLLALGSCPLMVVITCMSVTSKTTGFTLKINLILSVKGQSLDLVAPDGIK